ncbi:MAG: 3-isopropylmalate dehydratase small subunit [Thermoproteota archaeon]|jgi:3-isopropylmalate/(R)-2-methylmalate dehydratase small subunit|nr:3-isopropylmalate dehydratase small subunit [Nitrosopumilaceae archaeon]
MKGNAIKYDKDNIDTDVILPGTYLKLHDYDELAKHAMEGLDPDFHSKVKDGDYIVAGRNFGCGSSREHAPIALSYSGIKAVLALSFARIFYRNAVDGAFLLPIEIDEDAYKSISNGDQLEISVEKNTIKNLTKNKDYKMKPFSELIGKIIVAGGLFKYKP